MKLARWAVPLITVLYLLLVPSMALAVDVILTVYPLVKPTVTAQSADGITPVSGTLHGTIVKTGNNNPSTRGFEWGSSTGNYSSSWNETGSFGIGTFSHTVANLTLGVTVYWRAFAINTVGTAYSSEETFTTLALPYPPTDFAIIRIGGGSINVTWTMGLGANSTYVRGSWSRFPRNATDGYEAYNGTGTWFTVSGLDFSDSRYFVSAWSENSYGLSEDYVSDSVGGNMILFVCVLVLCLFLMGLSYKTRDILMCTLSFFAWIGLALWVFFSGSGFFDLSDSYAKIFVYVFFGLAFVPLIWSMNRSIRFEATGREESRSWTEEGSPPSGGKELSETEKWYLNRDRIRSRIRG